jgi:hypothetical protein
MPYFINSDVLGTGCGRRLGMVSGDIADFQIETSSNPAHIIHARAFNSMKAWCPTLDDKERWLMVKIKLSLI